MVQLLHIHADDLLLDGFRLGRRVYESGFRPKHAISIWRGGTPIGLAVDAYFRFQGLNVHHTAVATSSYVAIGEQSDVVVKGLEHLTRSVCREDGLLIIDDVYETGRTIQKIVEVLRARARRNAPEDIRVAVVHRKTRSDQYDGLPVMSLEEIDDKVWIDYPHEISDLVNHEDPDDRLILEKSPEIHEILRTERFEPEVVENPKPYVYRSAHDLMLDCLRLGVNLVRSDFEPDFLVALWPGGINAGLVLHEVYKYFAKKQGRDWQPDHIALNTTGTHLSYRTNILGLDYLTERVQHHHKLLLVDTVFRSGRMMSDVVNTLKESLRRNLELDNVRIASVYWNPDDQSTWTVRPFKLQPDYYLKKVDHYVIYPQSVNRLLSPRQELAEANPRLREILFG